MDREGQICVFVKEPLPGRVKTRLAAAVGPEAAAALARAFFLDTLAALGALDDMNLVVAAEGDLTALLRDFPRVACWPQGNGDLGARLEAVLGRALRQAPYAIALGADSPGLPLRLIERARQELDTAEAVIGPTTDGGFYLLGLRACPHGLLADLPWSASDSFARTLERLRARGGRVAVLETWFDVDRPADLQRLSELIERRQIEAPRSARELQRLASLSQALHP